MVAGPLTMAAISEFMISVKSEAAPTLCQNTFSSREGDEGEAGAALDELPSFDW